jgi:hypothetical protein
MAANDRPSLVSAAGLPHLLRVPHDGVDEA